MNIFSTSNFPVIIDILSLIINSILTIVIIYNTQKNASNQQKYEEKMNMQQLRIQEKQQKIDIFPYRRNVYLNLFKIFQQSLLLNNLIDDKMLKDKSVGECIEIYKTIININPVDSNEIFLSFKEAKYIFPDYIYSAINRVNNEYDNLLAFIQIHETLNKNLAEEQMDELKNDFINNIKNRINNIIKDANYLNENIHEYMKIN